MKWGGVLKSIAPGKERKKIRKNIHLTVKPIELMTHLVSLFAPKDAVILDPFLGSGSTGKAVAFMNREKNKNYKFIGYDLNDEFVKIAEKRINYALEYVLNFEDKLSQIALKNDKYQKNIWDFLQKGDKD